MTKTAPPNFVLTPNQQGLYDEWNEHIQTEEERETIMYLFYMANQFQLKQIPPQEFRAEIDAAEPVLKPFYDRKHDYATRKANAEWRRLYSDLLVFMANLRENVEDWAWLRLTDGDIDEGYRTYEASEQFPHYKPLVEQKLEEMFESGISREDVRLFYAEYGEWREYEALGNQRNGFIFMCPVIRKSSNRAVTMAKMLDYKIEEITRDFPSDLEGMRA